MTAIRKRQRRGNATVIGLLLGSLLGFSAMSIDIGMVRVAGTELQVAIDAAALGGVGYLDGTQDGIDKAYTKTPNIAGMNPVLGETLALASADVEVGIWDEDNGFARYVPGTDDPQRVNAVRVNHRPADVRPGLAQVAFGRGGYPIDAAALAVREVHAGPLKNSNCFLPIAIPECSLSGLPPGTNPDPMKVEFSPSPSDNVGWADINGNPNSSDIRRQLNGQCSNGTLEVGNTINVSNGQNTTALQEIGDILNDTTATSPDSWPTSLLGPVPDRDGISANLPADSAVGAPNFGNIIQGPVAIVDAGCPNPAFTGDPDITGIGWGLIYDVDDGGSGKNIFVQIDFVNEYEIFGDVDDNASGPNTFGLSDPKLVVQ